MTDADRYSTLVFALAEAALFVLLAVFVARGVHPGGEFATSVPVAVRLAAVAILLGFAAAPLWVWYDVRRRGDAWLWVHATLLPLFNLLGLAAYLHHRTREDESSETT